MNSEGSIMSTNSHDVLSPELTESESHQAEEAKENKESRIDVTTVSKCPLGFDSKTFKLGPFSCVICRALLFESSKCVPCSHVFCKACILRFKDCPSCGADIEKIEADINLQKLVDKFIEGHGRIKRPHAKTDNEQDDSRVIYEDVSLERGAFLVQQSMRAFRAQNMESAKARLSLCAEDIRGQIEATGTSSELCSRLGAVLGMLGDCCRSMGDSYSSIAYFEESVIFLSKLPVQDAEIIHTLSVSLNKIGDLKYHQGELEAARSYYARSLDLRRGAIKSHLGVSSQVIDVAVSLAKVADLDLNLGNEEGAHRGFEEAFHMVDSLALKPEESALEPRRRSVMEFLQNQLANKSQ